MTQLLDLFNESNLSRGIYCNNTLMDIKFFKSIDLLNESSYVRNLYLYIQLNLKRSRKNYEDAQSIQLNQKLCGISSKSNYYKAIKRLTDLQCILKVDLCSTYIVNPRMFNVMSKPQLEAFNKDLDTHRYNTNYANNNCFDSMVRVNGSE